MLQFAQSAIRVIARISTVLAMVGMALMVLLIAASILLRMIDIHIPAVDDLASILLAAVFSFGLAAAVGANEHLSINLLVDRIPEKPRWWLTRATEAISVAVSVYLLVGIYHLFSAAFQSNQKMLGALPIPRYLPMSIVLVGIALFALALALVLVRNVLSRQAASGPER